MKRVSYLWLGAFLLSVILSPSIQGGILVEADDGDAMPAAAHEEFSTEEPVYMGGIDGVVKPKLIRSTQVWPEYPSKAKGVKEARVNVLAIVEKDGSVTVFKVRNFAPKWKVFETRAIQAVKQWRYQPATKDGIPVRCYQSIVVQFALD